jgi:hypothetical protein
MIVLAIDPGPVKCGVVLYDSTARQVLNSYKAATVDEALSLCRGLEYDRIELVAIERVQSMGQAGASLLQTSEVVGRLHQRALDSGLPVVLLYRREVCSHLHVHGAGKDAQVRQRMIEVHGGSREIAVGTKKNPGALHGVASHAWQALGLAYVAAERAAREEG